MFTFLLVVHALIAAILVGVILMQRSEGGGLGMGGSPTGLMSARGAADFLTRATTVLATLFVLLSIGLAVLATRSAAPATIDTSLARQAPVPTQSAPTNDDPLAAAAGTIGNTVAPAASPAPRAGPSTGTAKAALKPAPRIEAPVATAPAVPVIRPTVTSPAAPAAPAPVATAGNSN